MIGSRECALHSEEYDPSAAREAFQWRSAGATHVGTRRTVNEDAFLDLPERCFYTVADGMGGHDAGDVASQMVVDNLRDLQAFESLNDGLREVLRRVQFVNAELRDYARKFSRSGVVGTTFAALLGFQGRCSCLWAGDSRVYLLRRGELRQVTRDHSQVEELVNLGLLDRAEAEKHPASNIITRAVGAADDLAVDVITGRLADGDAYLLCSDGLTKAVSDPQIADLMAGRNCGDAVEALIDQALANGAKDNVTAIVAQVERA